MTAKTPPYTYKDFETGKVRKTHGKFSGWTKPTGLMNARYAIFKNPRGDVLVPEPLLTPETKTRIATAKPPRPPAGSGLQMQSSFGGGGGQTYFTGASPKKKGKPPAAKPAKAPKPKPKAAPKRKAAPKKTAAKPAKAKPQKTAPAAPKLTAAQAKRLAATGRVTVKRGGKFVTITKKV